jgi:uncharacterized RDD family membrane protein YckC
MVTYDVPTGSPPPLASITNRFLAWLVDGLVLFIPRALGHVGLPVAGPILVAFFYFPIFYASPLQATIGMRAFRIRVTDTQGRTLTIRVAFIRYLVALASTCMAFAGHLLAFFTERRQTLHDLIADSIVTEGETLGLGPLDAWVMTVRRLLGLSAGAGGDDSSLPNGPR